MPVNQSMKKSILTFLLCLLSLWAAAQTSASPMKTYAFRLHPGQDLKREIENFIQLHNFKAATILSCVGSLTEANIRFANQPEGKKMKGYFEIVSLPGVLSVSGSHIHISISDAGGRTTGGHLLEGCKIYTTAEIVIGELENVEFSREMDSTYGYKELNIHPRP